ncbi:Curved DNA-binding protein [Pseudobythopirellula maris]|uniref:Curved DNA-binding protein n=1 Tax=Pseudobythopirellula maris TaxID=2527991 RepID=A0A5C5ZNE6_9BACT|nr:J domain-containing protein [Pseudobythopirellula maris]TWT88585.1 Curved DNA-binding protein [Pseudobythopirellula maris]
MAEDYYKVLGVKRNAQEDEIRRAYRELARKYHPDLHPDDESAKKKFQEVQVAFEVLNDKKKREKYDKFGAGFENMSGGPGRRGWPGAGAGGPGGGGAHEFDFDLNDIFGGSAKAGRGGGGGFADLFKQFGGGAAGAGPGAATGRPPAKGADLEHEITIPFATAVLGGEAAIQVRRANGREETISVKIPAGVDDGKKIRLKGQGDPGPRGAAGDLLLTIRAAPHPCYRRTGNRLDVTVPITLAEAARGAKVDVPTPRGVITLTIPAGSSSGKRLRVKGHGVRAKDKPAGDLYAEIEIAMPEGLSDKEIEQIAKIAEKHPQEPRADLRW